MLRVGRCVGPWAFGWLVVVGLCLPALSAEPKGAAAPADLVKQQLAAGEFAPAIQTAAGVKDPQQRTALLRQVSEAQRAVGEFGAARETAGLIRDSKERARDRGETVKERSRSGGGTGADFTQLIDLITSTLDPESWDLVGGPGSVREFETGVRVDPNGQLRALSKQELTGRLQALGSKAREADLNADMARQSTLRMVSLPRLERAVAEHVTAGRAVPETLRRLAGLSRIQYVFVYPEDHEIVIAGPAEGWKYDDAGRPVGRESGKPALDLDDLVVVLRTFSSDGQNIFGCSINPREANLKSVKEFAEASNKAGPLQPGQVGRWLKEMQSRLGVQDVQVYGVPDNTRIARVIVEADYRMKLIGIDKLDVGRDIPSYFDILPKLGATGGGQMDALRWWLTMKYSGIDHSPDRSSFEIRGSSVLCQSEHQFVTSQGKHLASGSTEPANQLFAANFTKNYAELAKRDPVFADLQNVFDLAMAAAICRQEHLYERAGWDPGVFGPQGAYRPAEVVAPKVVESVINHRVYNGKEIVVQVAGGVRGDILKVAQDKSLSKESPELTSVGQRGRNANLPEGRWWWDAK